MAPSTDHVRHLLGAFALGHLDADEATAVRAHLERCEACRTEAEELAAVAAVLPTADPEHLGEPAAPPDDLLGSILQRIERERERSRAVRRRAWVLRSVAAAAVVALVVAIAVVVLPSGEPPSGEVVALTSRVEGARGEAVVHRDPESTWVELTTSGLEPGVEYAVWLEETRTGERARAGTFVGVTGDLYISLYSTLPRDDVAAVGVSSLDDGRDVMTGAVPEPSEG
jgi:anti-sigma-K factor RskA